MTSYGHRDLKVWQKSMDLAELCYRATAKFPTDERYGLTPQIRRAAVSIASNIAEGKGRTTVGEYGNYLSIARGSLKELETQLELSRRLSFLEERDHAATEELCTEISKMLTGLKRAIRR
jgi:four helix bundle protein